MTEPIVNNLLIDEDLLKVCRDKTLEVTGIDVHRKYPQKSQNIVNARICFIAVLSLLTEESSFSENSNFIGDYITIDRATVYFHKENFINKIGIKKDVYSSIEDIKNLVSIHLLNNLEIPKFILIDSIELKLNNHYTYLATELDKTSKLLQLIKSWKKD